MNCSIEQSIANAIEGRIKEKYSKQFENLQYDLNYLNSQFKEIASNLSDQERKTLTENRDSIKQNPCNFTIKN